ncbi:hypothetical protein NQ315_015913 [Exocentrus adspersus]|uniref:DNA-directed DNA polymerase n=1 Tax=Exocentrus adspersus TaxID=1586481 RepID=A0AAV8V7W3_9CUCU|nr:hypothetical protein NQ315_015913 [Exocentrus adspersus]
MLAAIIARIQALLTRLVVGSTSHANNEDIKGGLCECTLAVRRLHKQLKKAETVGEKQHLLKQLREVKSMTMQLKMLQKKGKGLDGRKETACNRIHWDDTTSAFDSRIRTGVITNLKHKDPASFLKDCFALFKRRINNALKKEAAVKVNTVFGGEFVMAKGDRVVMEHKYFTTSNSAIYRDTDLEQWFNAKVIAPIVGELSEFQERDSGWALNRVVNLGVNINKFTPQVGSSYIELPQQIKAKQACINVNNNDQACFAWALTSAMYPVEKNPQRISKYPHYSEVLKLKGVQFPITLKQISNVEKQNNLSINVYILEKRGSGFVTLPTYLTNDKKGRHINLLLIQSRYGDVDDEPLRYHYVWIKDLSRLLSSQLSKHKTKKHFCDRCLHYFSSMERLSKHYADCKNVNDCKVRLPNEDQKYLKFKNFKNKEKVPFVVYADLESVLKQVNSGNKYQHHLPAAVGYYVKCSYDPSLSFYQSYRGEDCMSWFAREMTQFAEDVETVFLCPFDIKLTPTQEADFNKATHCHICEQPFKPDDVKVRDHNHLIPENNYRDAAHNSCNINYKDGVVVPVIFHNLSGYDANFIVENIANDMPGRVDLLPITKEKYISFTKNLDQNLIKFRFIDSFRFMNSSLDTLASSLTEFTNLKEQFPDLDKYQFNLLTRKGIFCYDYIDNMEKFDATVLPPIDRFYNKLTDSSISDEDYQHAKNVWAAFNIKNLGEYTDLYMKTDILLLVDVFERFRNSSHMTYNLDPAHYYTLPGYTWDCMLFKTRQTLELLTDIDMLMFVERGIRGGLSQVCAKRKSVANNKYMPDYNPNESSKYLMYFDVNNQYGWAMSQSLPYGGFKWVDPNIDVLSISDESSKGYILEVDLEYPNHLHDVHKDLPFCPEHSAPPRCKNVKLLGTLHNKTRYIIHYRALKQALANGLILTKIHRALEFDQSPWLKSYIDLNTALRQAAKNDFEKNLFKLMNNAVFGKTMENIRRYSVVKLVNKWSGRYGAEALISKPEFKAATIFNKNLVAIELRKCEIYFCKPIYVGMCILDLAKTTIYDFHYGYMKPEFDDDCSALYTDTDSLIYEIRNRDPYEIIRRDCHLRFDTSDYPANNGYNIPQVNKKVLGMMKDEFNGTPIELFVGLRSKMYTVKRAGSSSNNIKKVKGIKKSVIKNVITLEDYLECVDNFKEKVITQNLIKSEKYQVYSMMQEKIALSPHDDKRYLTEGSYDTLPWGHYSIIVESNV